MTHDPLLALRERNFRLFALSRLFSGAGMTLLNAAIAWQVYDISGSALQLGLIGLVRFVPALVASLLAGAIADRYDRRRIVLLAQSVPVVCSAILFTATRSGVAGLPLIYGLVFLIALGSAFENPARQALLPLVVPRDAFMNAVTVSSTIQQMAFVTGPIIGGALIGTAGVAQAYGGHVILYVAAIIVMVGVRPREPEGERRKVSLTAIKEGVTFVRRRQVLLGAMTLDMFAVIFGGAVAMVPIYAEKILKVGPGGYGLLTSSQGVGALLASFVMVAIPPVKRTGRALLIGVGIYGLATIAFGLSRSFPLTLAAYALTGIADQVSVIMRQTTIQLATPDALRGRVSSVSSLFIGASNQVGMVESGLVASAFSPTASVVSGALGCLAVVGLVAVTMPELRAYQIARPAQQPAPSPAPVPATMRIDRREGPAVPGDTSATT